MSASDAAAWRTWDAPKPTDDLRGWQAGRCAWCDSEPLQLVKDHCHMTGLVRGLLCRSCNVSEGTSHTEAWNPWRRGDNPAARIGHYEVYVNNRGLTALSPWSTLIYYSRSEQIAWWEQIERNLQAGAEWPLDAPWTENARACKAIEDRQTEEAFARMDDWFSSPGGAA